LCGEAFSSGFFFDSLFAVDGSRGAFGVRSDGVAFAFDGSVSDAEAVGAGAAGGFTIGASSFASAREKAGWVAAFGAGSVEAGMAVAVALGAAATGAAPGRIASEALVFGASVRVCAAFAGRSVVDSLAIGGATGFIACGVDVFATSAAAGARTEVAAFGPGSAEAGVALGAAAGRIASEALVFGASARCDGSLEGGADGAVATAASLGLITGEVGEAAVLGASARGCGAVAGWRMADALAIGAPPALIACGVAVFAASAVAGPAGGTMAAAPPGLIACGAAGGAAVFDARAAGGVSVGAGTDGTVGIGVPSGRILIVATGVGA